MEIETKILIYRICTAIFIFTVGFMAAFFSTKMIGWNIKLLTMLFKNKAPRYYKWRLEQYQSKYYLYMSRFVGIIFMLIAIGLFVLSINAYN
jgi:hypothetical protein